jgi:glutaryl-CoA dehydrogenase
MLRAASRQFQALNGSHNVGKVARGSHSRRWASSTAFNWEDPLAAAELYTEEELAIQDTARQYSQERLLPRVLGIFPLITCTLLLRYLNDVTEADRYPFLRGVPK